jgi:hypothetical protein
MTEYLWQILELLVYFNNYWLGRGALVKGLSLLACMLVYLPYVVGLLTYLDKDYMYLIILLVSASVLDMHDYVLVEVVKLLAYLKPSFGLSWVLWRWIVVYLHACLFTYSLGWELLPIWLRTICTCCKLWS